MCFDQTSSNVDDDYGGIHNIYDMHEDMKKPQI
jgi:hypothetical protein